MHRIVLLCAVAALLTGCVGAAAEVAQTARAKATVNNNIEAAQKGDRVAQYKVGDALCCSATDDEAGIYNTRDSVKWLCASAAQGYGRAMNRLGEIYSGNTVHGVRLMRRVANSMTVAENLPVAYAWYSNAKTFGVKDAAGDAEDVWKDMTPAQQATAKLLADSGLKATCQWDEAITASK